MIIARKCTAAQLAAGYREARSLYRIERDNASATYRVFSVDHSDQFVRAASLRAARRIVADWIRYDRERFAALQLAERAAVRCYQRCAAVHGVRTVSTSRGAARVSHSPIDARTWNVVRPVSFAVVRATADALWSAAETSSYTPQRENAAFLVSMKSAERGGAK